MNMFVNFETEYGSFYCTMNEVEEYIVKNFYPDYKKLSTIDSSNAKNDVFVNIPENIEGHPVTELTDHFLEFNQVDNELYIDMFAWHFFIPSSITKIGDAAHIATVIEPADGIYGAPGDWICGLELNYAPEYLTIHGKEGSYANSFALKNHLPFVPF